MKESKLIQLHNKVEALGNAMNRVIQELGNLKDLSIGTMELVKNFSEYKSALEKLKKDVTEKQKKETKEKK